MKSRNILISFFLIVSCANYCEPTLVENVGTNPECELEDDQEFTYVEDEEFSTESLDQSEKPDYLDIIKNRVLDLAPTLAILSAAKVIMNINQPTCEIAKKYPTVTALLAALVVADQMLPNGLNSQMAKSLKKRILNNTNLSSKTAEVPLAVKALGSLVTYKIVRNSLS